MKISESREPKSGPHAGYPALSYTACPVCSDESCNVFHVPAHPHYLAGAEQKPTP